MKYLMILVVLLGVSGAHAEPDSAVQYLMNEPVTLFDLGMLRLEQKLKQDANKDSTSVFIRYNWPKNRLEISIYDYRHFNFQLTAEKTCKTHIELVRISLVVLDGKPIEGSSFLDDLFSHVGFTRVNKPENIGESLDAITRIHAIMFNPTPGGSPLKCEGPLLGTDIFFKAQ